MTFRINSPFDLQHSFDMRAVTSITFGIVLFLIHIADSVVLDFGNIDIATRQVGCSSYGEFEPYTGPCETTSTYADSYLILLLTLVLRLRCKR